MIGGDCMGKNFYISDLHFGHKNIIRYDNRPFKTTEEMDNALIENWNKVVSNEDTVYILGDISWHDDYKTAEIFRQLKGTKILIKGNHDNIKRDSELAKCFARIQDYAELYLDKKNKVVMSHYPMPFWNGQFRDTVHLYGHVHNSHQWNIVESWMSEARALQDIPMRAYNVGCMMDYMNYTPRTLDEIIEGYNNTK
jgi:calcineurin-like phosphoesterase family protein